LAGYSYKTGRFPYGFGASFLRLFWAELKQFREVVVTKREGMPELPDIENYCLGINRLVCGQVLHEVALKSPFLLRTVEPKLQEFEGQRLVLAYREAKQIVLEFESGMRLLIHLMIAGRLRWRPPGVRLPRSNLLASLGFSGGTLYFTEAGKKRRARLYALPRDLEALVPFQRGGLEVLACTQKQFSDRLALRNHTLRRALTDQALFSGIGNAYSDEICFHARLSPLRQSHNLTSEEVKRLYRSCRAVLKEWTARLAREVGRGFPEKVTAFHSEMAVHGRYGQLCRECGTAVQRIRYASNETNYCPQCQNEGRLLADRSLSRLLKADWPKTPEELEYHMHERRL
jgi:formamidopyrimidine-DNA glycosylase